MELVTPCRRVCPSFLGRVKCVLETGGLGYPGCFGHRGQTRSAPAADDVPRTVGKAALDAAGPAFRAETVRALNAARPGPWSEDPAQVLRAAGERFRRRALQKRWPLRVAAGQDAFSPGGPRGVGAQRAAAGAAPDGGGARDRAASAGVAGRTRALRARR